MGLLPDIYNKCEKAHKQNAVMEPLLGGRLARLPQQYDEHLLEKISDGMSGMPVVPCTGCHYCMPCPYGVDIPGNFAYYNDVINKGKLPAKTAADYAAKSKAFVDGYKLCQSRAISGFMTMAQLDLICTRIQFRHRRYCESSGAAGDALKR